MPNAQGAGADVPGKNSHTPPETTTGVTLGSGGSVLVSATLPPAGGAGGTLPRGSQVSESAHGIGDDTAGNRLLLSNASFAFGPNKDAAMLSRVRQKRKGDTHTTLFVNTGGGEPAPSHRHTSRALNPAMSSANGKQSSGPDATDVSSANMVSGLMDNVMGALGALPDGVQKVFGVLRQTMLLTVFVLLILLICQAVLLWFNLSLLSTTIQIQTYKNSQLVQIASHLTKQMNGMENALSKLEDEMRAKGRNATETAEYQDILFELRGMEVARQQSLKVLREATAYHGPLADTEFLVDQHVEFEAHVQQLAREEIAWLGIITRNEHHQLHRRMEQSISSHHPLFRVSSSAYQLAQKWMHSFYGDEQRIRRYWEMGEAERRRVVSDLQAQLATSFDVVRITSPSTWRWIWGGRGGRASGQHQDGYQGSTAAGGGGGGGETTSFSRLALLVLLVSLVGMFFLV